MSDMGALASLIRSLVDQGKFGYQAIIVDEAQDFGQDVSDNGSVNILAELNDAMILNDGCFYAFYDKNQVVNSKKVPSFIANADCKLTLYRNCRNTKKIAETSFSQLNEKPKLIESAVTGEAPALYFADPGKTFSVLSKVVKDLTDANYKQIVVLTVKKFRSSCLRDFADDQKIKINNQVFPFYSCAQYKGLESDSVILVDVTKETFLDDRQKLLFYVGTSRAKFRLSIVSEMTNEDCKIVDKICLGDSFLEDVDYRTEFSLAIASAIPNASK
jgi:DNA helicase IV